MFKSASKLILGIIALLLCWFPTTTFGQVSSIKISNNNIPLPKTGTVAPGAVSQWFASAFGGGIEASPYVIKWGGVVECDHYGLGLPEFLPEGQRDTPKEGWNDNTGTQADPIEYVAFVLTTSPFSGTDKQERAAQAIYTYSSLGFLENSVLREIGISKGFWEIWDRDGNYSLETKKETTYTFYLYRVTIKAWSHTQDNMQKSKTNFFAWTPELLGTTTLKSGDRSGDGTNLSTMAPIVVTQNAGKPEYCQASGMATVGFVADISSLTKLYPDLDISNVELQWVEGEGNNAVVKATQGHAQPFSYSTDIAIPRKNTYGVRYNTTRDKDPQGMPCLSIPSKSGYSPYRLYGSAAFTKDVNVYATPATPRAPTINAGFINKTSQTRAASVQYGTKLSAKHVDGITYKWYYDTPTEDNKIGEGDEITIYPTGTVTVVYVAYNENDCTAPSAPISVSPISLPTVKGETIDVLAACNNGTTPLTIKNMQLGGEYKVIKSDGSVVGSGSPDVSNTTLVVNVPTGTYKVVAVFTDNMGGKYELTIRDNISVGTINLTGSIDAVTNCGPGEITLTIKNSSTRSEGTASYQYEWYDASKNVIAAKTTSTSIKRMVNATTTFYARIFDAHCESDYIPVTVTINDIPATPAITATTGFIGSPTRLAVNNPGSGVTYNWYKSNSSGEIDKGAKIGTGNQVSYTVAGVSEKVWVIGTSDKNCDSAPASVTITSVPLPVAVSVEAPANICDNGVPVINLNSSVSGTTYRVYKKSGEDTWAASPSVEIPGTGAAIQKNLPEVGTYKVFAEKDDNMGVHKTAECGIITISRYAKVSGAVNPVERCGTGSITLTAINAVGGQGNYQYEWYDADKKVLKAKSTQTAFTTTVSKTGTYYLKIISGECESDFIPVVVTVNPLPGSPSAPQVTSGFIGSSSKVTVTRPAETTLKWYKSNSKGEIDKTSQIGEGETLTYSVASTSEKVWVVPYSVLNCEGTPLSVEIVTTPLPVAVTATVPANVCDNAVAKLTLKSTETGTMYRAYKQAGIDKWESSPSLEIEGTGSQAEANLPNVGTYKVFAEKKDAMNVVKTAECGVISVNRYEKVTGNVDAVERCGEGIVILTAYNAAGGNGTYQYEWYDFNKAVVKPKGEETSFSTTVRETKDFYLKIFSDGCESDFIPVKATVNPLPAAPTNLKVMSGFIGSPSKISLTATGNNTYRWYKSNSQGTADFAEMIGEGREISYTVNTESEKIWVVAVSELACEGIPAFVEINTIPLPQAVTVEAPENICDNGTPKFKLKTTVAGTTYRIYKKSGEDTWSASPSVEISGTGVPGEGTLPDIGTYKVFAEKTDELNLLKKAECGIITVNRYDKVTGGVDPMERCGEGSITLTAKNAAGGNGTYQYEWYDFNKAVVKPKSEEITFTTNIKETGTYYLKVISADCESDFIPVKVTVNPLPAMPTAPKITAGFVGEPTKMTVENPESGIIYTWYKSDSKGEIDKNAVIGEGRDISYIVAGASEKVWVVSSTNIGCESIAREVDITAVALPSAVIVEAAENICDNGTPRFKLKSTEAGTFYRAYKQTGIDKWAEGQSVEIEGTGNSIEAELPDVGTYKIMAEKTDNVGAVKKVECGIIVINRYEKIEGAVDAVERCGEGSITLTAKEVTGGSGKYEYAWYDYNKAVVKPKGEEFSFTTTIKETKDFYLKIFSDGCESDFIPVKATVNPLPDAPASPKVTAGFIGEQSKLAIETSIDDVTYKWYKSNSQGTADFAEMIGEGREISYTVSSSNEKIWVVAVTKLGCQSTPVSTDITTVGLPEAQSVSAQEAIYINEKPVVKIEKTEASVFYRAYKNVSVDKWASSPSAEAQGTGGALELELNEVGTYKVMAEKTDNMGLVKATQCGIVSIDRLKEITAVCPEVQNCGPGEVTLLASSVSGGVGEYQYEWYNNLKAVVKARSDESYYRFTAPGSAEYYLRVYSKDYVSDYIKANVVINPLIDFGLKIGKVWQEQGESFDLMSLVDGGNKKGTWAGPLVNGNVFSVKGATPGQVYELTYTEVTDKGCTTIKKSQLTVYASEAKWIPLPDLCDGTERFNLADYVTPKGGEFTSDKPEFCEKTGIIYPSKAGAGKYTITYAYKSEAGVDMTSTKTIEIKEKQKIEIDELVLYTIPQRDEVITISNPVEGVEYKWYNVDGKQVNTGQSYTTRLDHGQKEMKFEIKGALECTDYHGIARLVMDTIPDYTPTAQYTDVTTNQPVQVTTNLEPQPTYKYLWKSENMAFDQATPFFVWHTAGKKNIDVVVSNSTGHKVEKSLTVNVSSKNQENPNVNYVKVETAQDNTQDGKVPAVPTLVDVIINSMRKQTASLKITDNVGRVYYEKEVSLDMGENKFTVERNNLPAEYYVYVYLKVDKQNLITRNK